MGNRGVPGETCVAVRHRVERRRVGAADHLLLLFVLEHDHEDVRERGHAADGTRARTHAEQHGERQHDKTVLYASPSATRRRQTCNAAMSNTNATAPPIAA